MKSYKYEAKTVRNKKYTPLCTFKTIFSVFNEFRLFFYVGA